MTRMMVIVMIRLIERRGRRSAPQEAAPFLLPTVNNQPLNKKRFQQPTSEKRKDVNNQPLKKEKILTTNLWKKKRFQQPTSEKENFNKQPLFPNLRPQAALPRKYFRKAEPVKIFNVWWVILYQTNSLIWVIWGDSEFKLPHQKPCLLGFRVCVTSWQAVTK